MCMLKYLKYLNVLSHCLIVCYPVTFMGVCTRDPDFLICILLYSLLYSTQFNFT